MSFRLFFFLFFTYFNHNRCFAQTTDNQGTGLIFDMEGYQNMPLPKSSTPMVLPLEVSLKQYAPTPQQQGTYSTCTDWSVSYAARTILEARKNNWCTTAFINQNAYYVGFLYALVSGGKGNCSVGLNLTDILKKAQEKGVPRYKDLATVSKVSSISGCLNIEHALNLENKIKTQSLNAWRLTHSNNKNELLNNTMSALANGSPVVIGMEFQTNSKTLDTIWQSSLSNGMAPHAVCVVGYKTIEKDTLFEIMNSWGVQWANKGFIWIKASDFRKYVHEAYQITLPFSEPILPTLSCRIFNKKDSLTFTPPTTEGVVRRFNSSGTVNSSDWIQIKYNFSETYCYMFSMDTTGIVEYHKQNGGNQLLSPTFRFDDKKGKNELCFVRTTEPLDDIDNLKAKINTDKKGDLGDKIRRSTANLCSKLFIDCFAFEVQ
jgi:Papain family cysteine protease